MFKRIRQLIQSDYGRDFGWYVEYDGKTVAELTDRRWEEMFWDSYAVIPMQGAAHLLQDDDLWEECKFDFRNRVMHKYPWGAFAGRGAPYVRDGRVFMRGLYLDPPPFTLTLVQLLGEWFYSPSSRSK